MSRPLWLLAAFFAIPLAIGATINQAAVFHGTRVRSGAPVQSAVINGDTPTTPICVNASNQPAPCQLHYFGGHVIPNVKVYVVYWGPNVADAGGDPGQFFSAVTNSKFIDWQNEYNTNITIDAGTAKGTSGTNQLVGRGTFAGSYTITPTTSGETCPSCSSDSCGHAACSICLLDNQISTELQSQISAGNLPPSDPNTIYFIYFPPHTYINSGGTDCDPSANPPPSPSCAAGGFCGYHSTYSSSGSSVYYAVIPDHTNDCGSKIIGCGTNKPEASDFDRMSVVSAHELAEAITDSEVGLATSNNGPPLGWYDQNNGEIGDMCANIEAIGFVDAGASNFWVQQVLSATSGMCESSRLEAKDFSIALGPTSATSTPHATLIIGGSQVSVPITTVVTDGGTQTLTLTALTASIPAGLDAGTDVSTVTAGGTAHLILNADATAAAAKDLVIAVKGTNTTTGVVHTASVLVQVAAAVAANDFTVSMDSSKTVVPGNSVDFNITTAQIAGTGEAATLTVSGLPTNVHAIFASSGAATGTMASTDAGSDTLTLAVDPAATNATVHFTLHVVTTSVPTPGHTAAGTLTIAVPNDFTLTVSPKTDITVGEGGLLTYTVATALATGVAEDVTFGTAALPGGFGAAFTPLHALAGSPSTFTLTAPSTPGGPYTITVTGTAASATHSDTTGSITVSANDYSLSIAPTTLQTMSSTSTLAFTVASATLSGAPTAISLGVSGLPTGVTGAFDSNNPIASPPGSSVLTLTANNAPGTTSPKVFTVTGTDSDGVVHTSTGVISVTTPNDFSITPSSTSVTIPRGSSTSVTVNTAVVSGSPGSIALSAGGLPAGVTGTLSSSSVAAGSGATLTLAATSAASLTTGTSISVTGTSGGVSHSASVTLAITGTPAVPSVSIAHPGSGDTVSGNVEIDAAATPGAGSTLLRIDVLVDGTKIGSGATSPAQVFWTSTEAANGSHAITATAIDADTGTATSAATTVTVDNSGGGSTGGGGKGGCSSSGGSVGALALLGLFALRRKR